MARTTSGYGQESTRRAGILTDQHGRKYDASIDKKSGFPVGVIQPKGWRAPFNVSQTYYRFDEDSPNQFRIDYDAILGERMRAHEVYDAEFKKEALDRGWDPADPTKAASVIQVIGPRPLPIEPIVACMQGNKWILGLTQVVDKRLLPFVKQKTDKLQKAVASMDFSDEPIEVPESVELGGESFEDILDTLEEAHDPDAIGGKRVPVKPSKKVRAA